MRILLVSGFNSKLELENSTWLEAYTESGDSPRNVTNLGLKVPIAKFPGLNSSLSKWRKPRKYKIIYFLSETTILTYPKPEIIWMQTN